MTLEQKYDALLEKLKPHIEDDHLPRSFSGDLLTLDYYKPFFTGKPDEGLFVRGDQLHYTERGEERLILKGPEEEILYFVFEGLTQSLATSYECKNRNPETEDTRTDWFPIQEKLLGRINKEWESRLKKKHELLLGDA